MSRVLTISLAALFVYLAAGGESLALDVCPVCAKSGCPYWRKLTPAARGRYRNAIRRIQRRRRGQASELAGNKKYQPVKLSNGRTRTFCNQFVRDLGKKMSGRNLPELRGRAASQFDQLSAAARRTTGGWISLSTRITQRSFDRAQELANSGKIVVIAWKNPRPTSANSGHIAIVTPNESGVRYSTTWKMKVPSVAQAGRAVFSNSRLSRGFPSYMKSGMRIFVLKK